MLPGFIFLWQAAADDDEGAAAGWFSSLTAAAVLELRQHSLLFTAEQYKSQGREITEGSIKLLVIIYTARSALLTQPIT